jgi:hypothetical protein
MATNPKILQTAQDQFPKSANKTVQVASAWRASDSTLERPAANGTDGWTPVHQPATYALVSELKRQGFSWVSLEASGTANRHRDVRITDLL